MTKNIAIWASSVLALAVVSSGGWYVYLRTSGTSEPQTEVSLPTYSSKNTATTVLTLRNQNYALAKVYQRDKKYDLALEYYQKALVEVEDRSQKAQVEYNIASMKERLGRYEEAIAEFKAIAADTDNFLIVRAYSVQQIGLMHYTYYSGDARERIVAETFKDSPYESFKKDDGLNMAYVRLFEYAASIYPAAISESRIAFSYTRELMDTLRGATTTPQGGSYVSSALQSIQAANADLQRMKDLPTEVQSVPGVLTRMGVTLGFLASLGAADPNQAELYLNRGLQHAAALGNQLGSFEAYNYAAFLVMQYGNARAADIKSLLAPFRAGNEAAIFDPVPAFYRTARTDQALAIEKRNLIAMGRMDSDFKEYLLSLGWKASDF